MAKLPHTAGGEKGEGGVPPAENDAGERDGGDDGSRVAVCSAAGTASCS